MGISRTLRRLRTPQTAALIIASLWVGGALGAPRVLWASDPVGPDETVLVVGDGLAAVETVHIERLADRPDVTVATAQAVDVRPEQVSASSLKFTIPKDFGPGAYRYSFGHGHGITSALNIPSVYWVQGDLGGTSSPGGWLRIFGRNVARTSNAVATLTAADGRSITLKAAFGGIWDASFPIPPDVPVGAYVVRLWNGNGDASAWREAGAWRVERRPLPSATTLDAKSFGARGDGEHDDTVPLSGALQALGSRGGGTLWLPRGYYKLSASLVIPAGVHLRGEDQRLVRLIWPDLPTPPYALIEGSSNFSVEGLTIFASNHAHIISGGFRTGSNIGIPDAENIVIRRVTVRASMYRGHLTPVQTTDRLINALKLSSGGPDTLRLSGRNLVVEDCDFYGSGRSLYLQQPRSARIERNRFYNGRWGWYSISGADGVIFENNDVIGGDLQSTGGGLNTLGKHEMFAQNIAFLRNRLQMLNGWDREAVTSDGPGGCYYGQAVAISDDLQTVTLSSPATGVAQDLEKCIGAGFFVLGGQGIGQVRRIRSVQGQTILLENPLDVPTDNSSIVSLTTLQRHYLIIGNELSDAGNGVQLFGSSVEHVVADNVSRRTWGFLNRGLYYRAYQPTWYTQFLHNRISEGDLTRDSFIGTWGSQRSPNPAPLSFATIIRSNALAEGAHIEVKGYMKNAPGVRDVIIEGNQIRPQVGAPIVVDEGAIGVLVRNNPTVAAGVPLIPNR